MRYVLKTTASPEDVLERAASFFAAHSRLAVEETTASSIAFAGPNGRTHIRAERHYDHTNVHAETDRVAGLDVTDLTKRFLYTLEHL